MRLEICGGCNWAFIGCSENVDEMIDAHDCCGHLELSLEEELITV